MREAIDLAVQVADALAAAHRAAITHRDVKPDNIFVSKDGYAKLGDFGIAKLREQSADPALTRLSRTAAGTILGSPQYLSPEQARSEPVDRRSDVFSFSAVLYEMVTGRQAFQGRASADVIASILNDDPPRPTASDPAVPARLEQIVLKGLEKEPDDRYQDMEDLVVDLRRLRRDLEAGRLQEPTPARDAQARGRATMLAGAGGAALGLAVGVALAAFFAARHDTGPAQSTPPELVRVTSQAGLEDEPSWAPDGRRAVYTSDEGGQLGIWMRQVPGERGLRIGRAGMDEAQPVHSPDGNWIAFISSRNRGGRFGIFLGSRPIEAYVYGQNGKLFVMPALGGTARKLADHAYDPSRSPDGRLIVFRSIRDNAWRLYIVSVEDGRSTPVQGVEPRALGPAWSPDGRWIAYIGGASAATGWDLYVVPAGGGTPVQLTQDRATVALEPVWSRDGRTIIFSSNRAGPLNLWRLPFRDDPPGAAGPPERLTTGIGEDVNASGAPDGSVAYAAVHTAPNIFCFDIETARMTPLTSETTAEDYPRISPDGGRLLFFSDRTGAQEVWTLDLKIGELTRVSRSGGAQNTWAPDGRTIAYGTPKGLQIVDLVADQARTIATNLSTAYPAFSRDGRFVAFQGRDDTGYRLYRAEVATGEVSVVPTPEGEPGNPSWSPDGTVIYYQLDQFGQRNIWAVDLGTGESRQITTGDTDVPIRTCRPTGGRCSSCVSTGT